MYRSIPKPPMPPPPANPGAFDFFEKFWSNSPLCCQFRRSNSPPIWGILKQLWNKFCKIFSHHEFLVQLVFTPHFKQRHIPRYNYIKRQQQKNSRGIDKSNNSWTRLSAESKNCEILLLPTADRCFDTKVKCPTGQASFWVKFPTVQSLTRVKCPGIARGGWAVLELTGTLTQYLPTSTFKIHKMSKCVVSLIQERKKI